MWVLFCTHPLQSTIGDWCFFRNEYGLDACRTTLFDQNISNWDNFCDDHGNTFNGSTSINRSTGIKSYTSSIPRCITFNQPIDNWDTSSATTLSECFWSFSIQPTHRQLDTLSNNQSPCLETQLPSTNRSAFGCVIGYQYALVI